MGRALQHLIPEHGRRRESGSALQGRFAVHAAIAGALAVLGLAALIYSWKHRRPGKADHGIQTKAE
ncbi:hypothetical protein [Micromonospora sp. NPDC048839]|uniref:hypothetical protein n=1 Tax=Micromonospora sp. NPDC048839 TaxID=3155641 RepID=UPI0033CB9846